MEERLTIISDTIEQNPTGSPSGSDAFQTIAYVCSLQPREPFTSQGKC